MPQILRGIETTHLNVNPNQWVVAGEVTGIKGRIDRITVIAVKDGQIGGVRYTDVRVSVDGGAWHDIHIGGTADSNLSRMIMVTYSASAFNQRVDIKVPTDFESSFRIEARQKLTTQQANITSAVDYVEFMD
ncbi:hypothetical protein D3P09_02210 [Paenibacillus pinisoli]|uniref:Uncharacterized protein n=1 Tax=Paenibacillus pinisoli TaxID=1276110 RepID=A0A3A6PNA6_9BACL|nr:hypothetical protein [Paenibacillus pinisoli]RJX40858.1 hypothetical protein D3P09_02210 [Paenibacillus pinisoli]